MSAELSRDVVGHVARLARIALDDHELDHFADHLGRILDHVFGGRRSFLIQLTTGRDPRRTLTARWSGTSAAACWH